MATYGANDAIYGSGTFGTARFGRVTPVISLTGVTGTGQIEPPEIGGFEVDIGVRLTATTLGTGSLGSFQVNVGAGLTGVTSTVSIGQVSISNQHSLLSVSGTSSIGSVGAGVTSNIIGTTATGQVGSIDTIDVSETIVSVGMTSTIGSVTINAVVFDFESVRNKYSRRRTVYIAEAA